jgi:EAL domain-containing protein (putative c-di-GMP-specific phosphodiesterase class I)
VKSRDEHQSDRRSHSLSILTTVRAALRDNRLLFAFQPVISAATGEVDYFECLLRMREPAGGIVAGGAFITTIEELGLIGFIDGYALEQTVRELSNYPKIRLGLNISSLTACDGRWLRLLISLLRGRPDLACRLIVEITETAALQDITESARFVDVLHHTGCRVALDDFGAGHTSLRQLRSLAVDTVKVDRSLIRNISCRADKRLVMCDLLAVIKSFRVTTVAEGVENAEDAATVRLLGFGYLQGYHMGPPTIERSWLGAEPSTDANASAFDIVSAARG